MFTPMNRQRSARKNCYLIEEVTMLVSTGHMFSANTLERLGLHCKASYFETLESAKEALRNGEDPASSIIIFLKNVPLEYYEKNTDGSFNLKRDNVSLLVAANFIEGIYFLHYDNVKGDFIYQLKSPPPPALPPAPNKPSNKCIIL